MPSLRRSDPSPQRRRFPPYLVMVIVGHLVVGGFLSTETLFKSSLRSTSQWAPAAILLGLILLQWVKGAVIGMQWALEVHGFGGRDDAMEA
ncbi:DUF983 domain-containing protein [Mesorhizobium sp. WSM3862]|uniref:DUF983 domain-containing protein n=1 Tax=Mesorhizobium sp. WSM3862 TaxID=632858 RepID=UPI0032AFCA64